MLNTKDDKIFTMIIGKVRECGKWLEFWSKDFGEEDCYTFCSKGKYFWDAIHKAELSDHVLNHGVVGLKLVWKYDGYNYEIKSISRFIL